MGSGVVIGDEEFGISEIQKSVDEILAARKNVDTAQMQLIDGPDLQRTQAQFYIIKEVLNQIARDKKIDITEADVSTRRSEITAQVGGESELPKALVGASLAASNLDTYLRILMISEKLNLDLVATGVSEQEASDQVTKLVTDTANKLGVKVNPKYGKWNPVTAAIEASDSTDGAVTPLP